MLRINKLWWKRVFANFTSTKSRIALQVARKIAPCDRALIHVCLAYLFLHSGQVLSSFKCYFKRKYLNLIDSNCDVDESSRSRVAICCVRLAARNFGNGRVVLCTWETLIASSGFQLLWERYVFFGFLCASCII